MTETNQMVHGELCRPEEVTCKFCQQPITIWIAVSYERDTEKLVPKACCNRCADLRVERRGLESKIKFICMMRVLPKRRPSEDETKKAHGLLTKLTRDYANMIARWHGADGMAWDEECVNLLLDKPEHWPQVLGTLWSLFRDWQKQGTAG